MNIENEQEQQKVLKREKEDAALRGEEEYNQVIAENDRHANQFTQECDQAITKMEQQCAEVRAGKHRIKVKFNEWEVRIGRELPTIKLHSEAGYFRQSRDVNSLWWHKISAPLLDFGQR
jgi:hypothetical protein